MGPLPWPAEWVPTTTDNIAINKLSNILHLQKVRRNPAAKQTGAAPPADTFHAVWHRPQHCAPSPSYHGLDANIDGLSVCLSFSLALLTTLRG